jgi:hypothetical protein
MGILYGVFGRQGYRGCAGLKIGYERGWSWEVGIFGG